MPENVGRGLLFYFFQCCSTLFYSSGCSWDKTSMGRDLWDLNLHKLDIGGTAPEVGPPVSLESHKIALQPNEIGAFTGFHGIYLLK